MALFIDQEAYELIVTNQDVWPEERLLNQSYLGYYQSNILCEEEKTKLYMFFNDATANSKKKIKRIKLTDADSANLLWDRLITKCNKEINYRNNKRYYAKKIMPTMEIVQWPDDSEIGTTYNAITRNAYIPKGENELFGTFIIPLIDTKTTTMFREVGYEGLKVIKVADDKVECASEPIGLKITENKNFFYLSELEPVDIFGSLRLNLYIHVKYSDKKSKE